LDVCFETHCQNCENGNFKLYILVIFAGPSPGYIGRCKSALSRRLTQFIEAQPAGYLARVPVCFVPGSLKRLMWRSPEIGRPVRIVGDSGKDARRCQQAKIADAIAETVEPGWVFRRPARFAEDGSPPWPLAIEHPKAPQRAPGDNSGQSVVRLGETDSRLTGTQISHPSMRIGSSSSVLILLMRLDTDQIQSRPSGAGLRSSMPALLFTP
jgi:hypothetical protein